MKTNATYQKRNESMIRALYGLDPVAPKEAAQKAELTWSW